MKQNLLSVSRMVKCAVNFCNLNLSHAIDNLKVGFFNISPTSERNIIKVFLIMHADFQDKCSRACGGKMGTPGVK